MAAKAVLLDNDFEVIGTSTIDDRKRVALTKAIDILLQAHNEDLKKIHFVVNLNKAGQILLSPESTVPLHEVWLYKNKEALDSVRQGLEEVGRGELVDAGSFIQYADEEIE